MPHYPLAAHHRRLRSTIVDQHSHNEAQTLAHRHLHRSRTLCTNRVRRGRSLLLLLRADKRRALLKRDLALSVSFAREVGGACLCSCAQRRATPLSSAIAFLRPHRRRPSLESDQWSVERGNACVIKSNSYKSGDSSAYPHSAISKAKEWVT